MELILTRHGRTPGNLAGRYVGRTDQPLAPEGVLAARAAGVFPEVTRVYVTPLLRTQQTAHIRFPNAVQVVEPGLTELDFGEFEGCTADELSLRAHGPLFTERFCQTPCPGGESVGQLRERAGKALFDIVAKEAALGSERVTFVIHGGVIIALMDLYTGGGRPLSEWLVQNCGGYRVALDPARFAAERRFDTVQKLSIPPDEAPRGKA